MALNAKTAQGGTGKKRPQQPLIEAGTYPVRLVQVLDLGIQTQRPYKGEEKPPAHMIHVTYEFVDEFMVDEEGNEQEDKPRWLSEEFPLYNLKADRAKSTQRYKALDPSEEAEGDWTELTGFPANALVTSYQLKNGPNAGDSRNKIDSLSAMRPRDAKKCPDLVNEPKVFVLDEPDMEVFQSLPEFLQEKIKGNLEYNGSALQKLVEGAVEEKEDAPVHTPEAEPEEPDSDDGDGEDEKPW